MTVFPTYEEVSKRQWSDKKLANHKKASAVTSIAGATTGLAGLGALTGGALLSRGKSAKLRQVGDKLNRATVPLGAVTGGIGGAGGYNFAAIQNQEAKRKPKTKVVVATTPTALKRAGVTKAFDAERSRRKRAKVYEGVTAAGGIASLGAAGVTGTNAVIQQRKLPALQNKVGSTGRTWDRARSQAKRQNLDLGNPKLERAARNASEAKGKLKAVTRIRNKNAALAGGFAALGAGGLIASDRIRSYNKTKGKSYSARYSPR